MAEVRIRDCACPGTPHVGEGDIVFLPDTTTTAVGLAGERAIRKWVERWPKKQRESEAAGDDLEQRLMIAFVTTAPTGWNLVDEKGEPVPFSAAALLDDWSLSRAVADAASELYTTAVLSPFLPKPAARSPSGSTGNTTSAPPTPTPLPSKRSSRRNTAGSERLSA